MFGKGKIDIVIQRTSYAPGDTISGNVVLTLKKPVKAREVSASLIGEYKIMQTTRRTRVPKELPLQWDGVAGLFQGSFVPRGYRRMSTLDAAAKSAPKYNYKTTDKTVRICDFKQQLDGGSEYIRGREYHFDVKIRTDIPTSPKWYLLARLDIPGGLDITRRIRIAIG
jgi:hypothetical protein